MTVNELVTQHMDQAQAVGENHEVGILPSRTIAVCHTCQWTTLESDV